MIPNKKNSKKEEVLEFDNIYHIYNKAISSDLLFKEENDYHFFLRKLERYISPIADVYSYCLIPNHFHLLIKIKTEEEIQKVLPKRSFVEGKNPIQQSFSNFFNSYSKSFNKAHNRKGRLFLYPFKRILVDDDGYLLCLINYIHRNPIHHGMVKNFPDWRYSSYNLILSNEPTNIDRDYILQLFGSKENFINFHEQNKMKPGLDNYSFD